tara:strand:- start:297 stop:674 length:378 start_codon:yes stop_codon:yes gene_type:complete
MHKKCKIQVKDFQMIVTLRKTITAEEIWKALPIKSVVNTWGDEVYFFTSVNALVEDDANDVINLGEIAYWPSGKAIAIGFGKTPASIDKEIRLADKCNIWGDCSIELQNIKTIKSGDKIFVEKCQ